MRRYKRKIVRLMRGVRVAEGRIMYGVVRDVLSAAGMHCEDPSDHRAILCWYDTLKEEDFWSSLWPHQIVNRIPHANVLCRKAHFARLMSRIQAYYPQLYSFAPRTYILPFENGEFVRAVARHDRRHIIKPDGGSLGAGIVILERSAVYQSTAVLSVAQEMVDSVLLGGRKFDLRIYALIGSVQPLRVYVYRGGVARFCADVATAGGRHADITNTAINRTWPGVEMTSITRMVPEVFEQLAGERGVDVGALWKRIDECVVLSVIAAMGFLQKGVRDAGVRRQAELPYSRVFQILGFDVLLDEHFKPAVLEVNYRPSLDCDTEEERRMKHDMLTSALSIVAPLGALQERLDAIVPFTKDAALASVTQAAGVTIPGPGRGNFVQVYPSGCAEDMAAWNRVLERVRAMPTTFDDSTRLPTQLARPAEAQEPVSDRLTVHVKRESRVRSETAPAAESPVRLARLQKRPMPQLQIAQVTIPPPTPPSPLAGAGPAGKALLRPWLVRPALT